MEIKTAKIESFPIFTQILLFVSNLGKIYNFLPSKAHSFKTQHLSYKERHFTILHLSSGPIFFLRCIRSLFQWGLRRSLHLHIHCRRILKKIQLFSPLHLRYFPNSKPLPTSPSPLSTPAFWVSITASSERVDVFGIHPSEAQIFVGFHQNQLFRRSRLCFAVSGPFCKFSVNAMIVLSQVGFCLACSQRLS